MLVSAVRTYLADFWGRYSIKEGTRTVEVVFKGPAGSLRFRCDAAEPKGVQLGTYWFDGMAIRVLASYSKGIDTVYEWATVVDTDLGSLAQTSPAALSPLPPVNGSSVRPDGGTLTAPLLPFVPRDLWEPALGANLHQLEDRLAQIEAEYESRAALIGVHRVRQITIKEVVKDESLINLQWFEKKRIDLGLRIQSLQQFVDYWDERPQLLGQQIQEVATLLRDLNTKDLVFRNEAVRFTDKILFPVSMTPPTEDDELVAWKWVKQWFDGVGPCICKDDSAVILPEPLKGPQPPAILGVTPQPLELLLQGAASTVHITVYDPVPAGILVLTVSPVGGDLTIGGQLVAAGQSHDIAGTQAALNDVLATGVFKAAANPQMSASIGLKVVNADNLFDEKTQTYTLVDAEPKVLSITGPRQVNEGEKIVYTVVLNGSWGGMIADPWATAGTSTPGDDWTVPVFVGVTADSRKIITVPRGLSRFTVEFQTIADEETEGTETLVFSIGPASATTDILDTSIRPELIITQMVGPSNVYEDEEFELKMVLSNGRGGEVEHPLFRTGTAESPGDLSFDLKFGTTVTWDPVTGKVVVPQGVTSFTFVGKVGSDFWTEKTVVLTMTSGAVSKDINVIYVSEYAPVEVDIERVNLVGCALVITLKATQIGGGTHTYEWEQVSGTPVNWLESRFQQVTTYEENQRRDDKRFLLWIDRGTPFEQVKETYVTTVGRDPVHKPMLLDSAWAAMIVDGGAGSKYQEGASQIRIPSFKQGAFLRDNLAETLRPCLYWGNLVLAQAAPYDAVRNLDGSVTYVPIPRLSDSYLNLEDDATYSLRVTSRAQAGQGIAAFLKPEYTAQGSPYSEQGPRSLVLGADTVSRPMPLGAAYATHQFEVNQKEQIDYIQYDQETGQHAALPLQAPTRTFGYFSVLAGLIEESSDSEERASHRALRVQQPTISYTFKTEGLGIISIG